MSPSGDRIAVPTNGHRSPHKDAEVGTHLAEATDLGAGGPEDEPEDAPDAPEVVSDPPVAPAAVAAGLGIITAIVLIVAGRRLGRRG